MPLHAAGVAGSPRLNGNSSTLLRAALEGAAEAGAVTEFVFLDRLSHRGCRGCETCSPEDRCVIRDPLTPVLERLAEARLWLLASPVYYDGPSGQFKLFFDRLRPFSRVGGKLRPRLEGKRSAGIILTYADRDREDYRRLGETLASYLSWFGDFGEVRVLAAGGLGSASEAAGRPALLEEARSLGRALALELGGNA